MELLKPCRKCGQPPVAGPAAVGAVAPLWVIACPNCGETTAALATIEGAAAFWNDGPDRGPALEDPSADGEEEEDAPEAGVIASLLPVTT
jgi:hypothetical protein